MSRWWLAVGPSQQWQIAFENGNIWGLKASGRPGVMWELVSENDRLLVYATTPVAGLVGYGTVRRKFRQDKPLWPQEVAEQKVLWPLRFEFDIDYLIPLEEWPRRRVVSQLRCLLVEASKQLKSK